MAVTMGGIRPRSRVHQIRLVLVLILVGLAVLTTYQVYRSNQSPYKVQVFATSTGWGYKILNNEKVFIHQPTIPGQSGMVGFASQEQARRVGEWVADKLHETNALPTLTSDELRQLGVKIP
ncbi:DUF4907 domain-containing protein [Spirosoma sp. KNUC1025]|uniref:DUF4907 domain-containing protein n=1 Tax=Spirosoma sp. KNUC1025 TaxID=2894082 RepID=UPI003864C8B4|nr:DUF4907 domain-containing protein [Spirosoma sp. KNUC1025]